MGDADPEDLPFPGAAVVVVIDADGEADDLSRLGIADGFHGDAELRIVPAVVSGHPRVPRLLLAVTRIAGLLFAVGVVHRDDVLAAGADDFGVGAAGVASVEVAVVPVDEDFHGVIVPSASVPGFLLGAVAEEVVILNPDTDVKVVRVVAREHPDAEILPVPGRRALVPDGAPSDAVGHRLVEFRAPPFPGPATGPDPRLAAIQVDEPVDHRGLGQGQGELCLGLVKRGRGGRCLAEEHPLVAVAARVGKGDVRLGPDAAGLCVSVLQVGDDVPVAGPGHFQFHRLAVEGGFQGGGVEFQAHVLNHEGEAVHRPAPGRLEDLFEGDDARGRRVPVRQGSGLLVNQGQQGVLLRVHLSAAGFFLGVHGHHVVGFQVFQQEHQ